MNKKSLIITVIVMILIIFVVLFTLVKTNIVTLNNEPKDSIEHILNEMTLEEKNRSNDYYVISKSNCR